MYTLAWWHYPLLLIPMLPTMWAIWHSYTHEFPTPMERLGWFGCATLFPVIGGLVYLIFGQRRVVR